MPPGTLPPLRRTSNNPNPWAKVLAYAPARWGKTNLTRTCPKPLVLVTELGDTKGLGTLADIDVPFIEIEDIDTMHIVATALSKDPNRVIYEGEEFLTVVQDSLSATGEQWLDFGKAVLGWDMIWDGGEGKKGNPRKDPRMAYPPAAEKARQTMKLLMNLPAHVLFLAREAVISEGQGREKVEFWAPELPGQKLPRELPGWPDATLRGVLQNGRRVFQTTPIGKTQAGFRVPPAFAVPTYIGTDMAAVFDLTLGKKEALERLRIGAQAK